MPSKKYDVFLSYNTLDKLMVLEVADYLRKEGLAVWFDEWVLPFGEGVAENIELGIKESRCAVVFIGKQGDGPWHKKETWTALNIQAHDPSFLVIPVWLPGAEMKKGALISQNRGIHFKKNLNKPQMDLLVAGIRGRAPESVVNLNDIIKYSEVVTSFKWKEFVFIKWFALSFIVLCSTYYFFLMYDEEYVSTTSHLSRESQAPSPAKEDFQAIPSFSEDCQRRLKDGQAAIDRHDRAAATSHYHLAKRDCLGKEKEMAWRMLSLIKKMKSRDQ